MISRETIFAQVKKPVVDKKATKSNRYSMVIFTNNGLNYLLDAAFSGTSNDLTLRLFKNNIICTQDTLIGAMVEADFTGYAEESLDNALWTDAEISLLKSKKEYPEISWTNTGASTTIYGYYIVYGGEIILTDRFGSARIVGTDSTIRVTPVINLFNQV